MNDPEKQKHCRYLSLCSKRLLFEMTGEEEFTIKEHRELKTLKEELGGDHKAILSKAKGILMQKIEGQD